MKNAVFINGWGYQGDKMNLPVADLDSSIPFYETVMGFEVVSRTEKPCRSAILQRDGIQMGLAENGGDPSQDGCFFAVDDLASAIREINLNAPEMNLSSESSQTHGDTDWRVFFIVAPDGLCYCLGERQD